MRDIAATRTGPGSPMKRILFVCSRNRLRSPTAEAIFSGRPGFEVASAGTDPDADVPLSSELIEWADLILVMEAAHRSRIQRTFRPFLRDKRIVCLNIKDRYKYMEPALIKLLQSRAGRYFSGT